jgi:2-polyprenyl-3-methyl-5-hydroxy-6-metoxy-1,4-benzoquinol methylase
MSERRKLARQLAGEAMAAGNPTGWFEQLYSRAVGDAEVIPWADLAPNPNLLQWLEQHDLPGGRALKIGCGLGDDAEELARRGLSVVAFDISETAIAWCRQRFPETRVDYQAVDLFAAPSHWDGGFDFVLESYTLQVLPQKLRPGAMERIAGFVKPGGTLLVIARAREPAEDPGAMPWPLMRLELDVFERAGVRLIRIEDFVDGESPPVRRIRAEYRAGALLR